MRDGVRLVADVYRPPGKHVPSLLMRTPYGRRLYDHLREANPLLGVSDGFAVVIQDLRGRGASEGEFYPNYPDARDGADTVAWIRHQSWSNQSVAMVGGSYNGMVQFQAARLRPSGLVAIAPSVVGALRSLMFPGGSVRLSVIVAWLTALATEASAALPRTDPRLEDLHDLLEGSPLERIHAFLRPRSTLWHLGAPIRHWLQAPPDDEYWTTITSIPSRPLPAMHTTGWYDLCATPAFEAYKAWSDADTGDSPQYITLGPWTHQYLEQPFYRELEVTADVSPPAYLALDRQLAFLKACLTGASLAEVPPVLSYVLGRNRWHEGTQWPPAGTRQTTLFLVGGADGTHRLDAAPSHNPCTVRYSYNPSRPVPTLGGSTVLFERAGPIEQTSIESRPDVLTFTSSPVNDEVEIAGSPTARILVTSSAPATDFIARLTLVTEDDRSIPICEGSWGGRLELLDTPDYGRDEVVCSIQLGPIHVIVASGRRLRLQITSSCYPEIYPNPNTGHSLGDGPPPRVVTAVQGLRLGGIAGSSLTLPVVRGQAGLLGTT